MIRGGADMGIMVGVDVGGTFTDLSLYESATNKIYNYKLSSTSSDPSLAIVDGINEALNLINSTPQDVSYLAHGTTVATNALIEKKGARIGLITTEGFKDLMEIGWQKRPNLYDLLKPKAPMLIPPGMRCEVPERILFNGEIRVPLDEEAVRKAAEYLVAHGAEAIAVCTLFSFLNPIHEKRIKEIILDLFPDLYVSASYELVQEFREYSRMSTVVLNAYLGPVMKKYVHNFEKKMEELGITVHPYVTQSNGSIISISETINSPIRTAVSGPSAGVVGAAEIGKACGIQDIITFDMGGTSADISLIKDGKPQLAAERLVEGNPARIPMIDIITIGAGGGSIAKIDEGGALKVGPKSAGANPGPACYQRGGQEPTVTDANVILGKLNQSNILGGRMSINRDLSQKAVTTHICDHSGLGLEKAAQGIISVVNANMIRAVRVVSVERGYDPREFTLMAFGGAGPLHACELAEEIGIKSVLIPPAPGTLCSLGLLMADTRFDLSRSNILLATKNNIEKINLIFQEMKREGELLLEKERIPSNKRRFICSIDSRYERQNYEINIPIQGTVVTQDILEHAIEDFHSKHEVNFGYSNKSFNVQFVSYRLSAVGEIEKPKLKKDPIKKHGNHSPVYTNNYREVIFATDDSPRRTPIYTRSVFEPGSKLEGPMIIEQMDTTCVIPPNWSIEVDEYWNIHATYNNGELL